MEQRVDGEWEVHKGPDLPTALLGHCVEHIHEGKILLTGGFDGKTATTTTYEFEWVDEYSGKWVKRPWSDLDMERYDHVCYSIDGTVYVTGGWHENFVKELSSQKYNVSTKKWEESNAKIINVPILRSSQIGEADGKMALIGGVSCQINKSSGNGKNCTKPRNVYELESNSQFGYEWKISENAISVPRSSHALIIVPTSIAFACKVD